MRSPDLEIQSRVAFLTRILKESGASGFVFGNSGGKDSALCGILCKKACDNTVGVTMPCHARRNYGEDMGDARAVAEQYGIETRSVDLSPVRGALLQAVAAATDPIEPARTNIAPRLRMTALYVIAASENRLVVGTGNRSEAYMGYFTKWGDGAYDVNPIADLTVTEVYALLRHLGAPESIMTKPPSGGLYDGQTDEAEMGVSYEAIDRFLRTGEANEADRAIIERFHARSEHKRRMPAAYSDGLLL